MSDLCLAHVYVHARFVFDSALYFFDLPGGQVQSVAAAGYSLVFKSERNSFSSPKGPREAYLLPVWKRNLVRIVSRHFLYFIQKLFHFGGSATQALGISYISYKIISLLNHHQLITHLLENKFGLVQNSCINGVVLSVGRLVEPVVENHLLRVVGHVILVFA